jgi:hypothetical protein
MRIAMKTLMMSFLSLAILMASLLIPAPVMALSNPVAQPQMLLGATTQSVPASTQETDSKLQSAIGSVTDGGGQTEKKGNTQERAKDGAKIDQMTQGLMKENGT